MRTTVEIDERVLERAKRLASRTGRTLGAVVTEALSAHLTTRVARVDKPFELIVRGKPGGRFPTQEEMVAAEEEDDLASLRLRRT